jgi:hypothetical protein
MAHLVLLAIGIFLTTQVFKACADAAQVPFPIRNDYQSDRTGCLPVPKEKSPESLFGPRWRNVLRFKSIEQASCITVGASESP